MAPYSSESQRNYVIGLYNSNLDAVTIQARPEVTVTVSTIRRWIDRYRTDGFDGLKTRPKSGRRRATTAEQDALIVNEVLRTPLVPAITTVRRVLPDLDVHKQTIYQR